MSLCRNMHDNHSRQTGRRGAQGPQKEAAAKDGLRHQNRPPRGHRAEVAAGTGSCWYHPKSVGAPLVSRRGGRPKGRCRRVQPTGAQQALAQFFPPKEAPNQVGASDAHSCGTRCEWCHPEMIVLYMPALLKL